MPEEEFIFKSGKRYFYGGTIDGIMGDVTEETVDLILDLLDEYIEVKESIM